MRIRLAYALAIALSLGTAPAPARAAEPAACAQDCLAARFQDALDAARASQQLPGIVAAFTLPDGRTFGFATGYADVERRKPMTPDTRLMSGSTGKMFVAATALSLANDGVLDLDAPISTWLGREKWFRRLPNGGRITLKMLLNHSSGLRDHVFMPDFSRDVRAGLAHPDHVFPPEKLVSYLFGTTPLFAPGQGYAYSDTGYILAGMIIEKASKTRYYDLVEKRFLYPLDLTLTSPSAGRIHAGLAQGYIDPQNPILPGETGTMTDGVYRFDPASEWTGGGLVTNAKDLARWAKLLFEGKALPADMTRLMLDARAPAKADATHNYGLGVHIYKTDLGPIYGHGGWFLGYRSFVGYAADRRVAIAVQCNADKAQADRIARDLLRIVLDNTPRQS